jgi:hypothetical protein
MYHLEDACDLDLMRGTVLAAADPEGYLEAPTCSTALAAAEVMAAHALIEELRARRYGEYYQLWRAIAARSTLDEAGRVLLDVLRREDPYLVRYHAAEALLALLHTQAFEPSELAAERPARAANIDRVERMLRERLLAGGPA